MGYFTNFDMLNYDFTVNTDTTPIVEVIVDLTERVQLNISSADLANLCQDFIITAGMKPEQIAYNLYNDPLLHWTILYVNNITNLSSSWPLSEMILSSFVTKKYGAGNEYNIHHYEKEPEGISIDPDFCLSVYGIEASPISNYDYEDSLNELKRYIQVINPTYISAFVGQFNKSTVAALSA